MVTALELLAGFDGAPPERFTEAKGGIELAYNLSKGRVLEEPNFLLCRDVLQVPFPAHIERPRPAVIADYMQVVACAKSLEEIRSCRVLVRKLRTKGAGRPGFTGVEASLVKDLMAGPKEQWVKQLEIFATKTYPQWREHFRRTGARLPDEAREALKSRQTWDGGKSAFIETKLRWLQAPTTAEVVPEIAKRLDAVLNFTLFVGREMLLGNYNIEKHDSDVYDQFQLHYLALDRFVLVTEDKDLSKRTVQSSQADRILSFQDFLGTL